MGSEPMTDDLAPSELGTLLWRLPVAVYRTTPDGRFLAGNPKLLELIGASSMEELLALDVRDLYVTTEQRDHMIDRVEAGVPIPPEEIQLRRLDGKEIWVRVSSRGVMGSLGEVAYFEGVLEDVTGRRQGDERLAETNRLLDAVSAAQNRFLTGADAGEVFDDLLDVLLELTASEYGFIAQVLGEGDERFLRSMAMSNIAWNDATREMFDRLGPRGMEFHNLNTLFGRVVLDNAPVISNDPIHDPRRGGRPYGHPPLDSFLGVPVHKGSSVIAVVALANRPDGYSERIASFLEPFLSTVGSIVQAVRERQARLEAEEGERIRDRRFRAVVDAAVDGVIVFDEAGVIEAFNPAAEQLFGYRADEIVGSNVRRLVHPDSVIEYEESARSSEASRTPNEMELVHRSGDVFTAEVSLGSFRLGGSTTLTAVVRDVTERKVTEDALRRAKEAAERVSRAKDEFLAGMSHELRTPLNGVIGLSSILARGTHGPLTGKQAEYVAQIEASGKHLLSLINDVLDLAKIEADRFEPELTAVSIEAVVDEALGMVREPAVSKNVTLVSALDSALPPVMADSRRVRQILVNLLGNGVKFTPSGGRVEVAAQAAGSDVVVTVSDDGIGIPPDQIEEVFEPFQQVESSLDRRHEGTGLGLALSRRLIERMGGTLAVKSVLGKGSEFTFMLPMALDAGEDAPRESEPDRVPGGTKVRSRVLVVEDNDVNRMMIGDYLTAHGLDVVTAVDGDEAVARAFDSSPDVILMDIQMPRRDGLSATRELKSRPETEAIPVIALTALAMKGDAERCLAAGCDEYLSKPCDPATVLQVVERHLSSTGRLPS